MEQTLKVNIALFFEKFKYLEHNLIIQFVNCFNNKVTKHSL